MEATGPYSAQAALALVNSGWKVSVVAPARINGFAQSDLARDKTDQADAVLLRVSVGSNAQARIISSAW
ncbi:MAG: transposase [Thiobacillus sp.]|nr:transposase [Thiobacillus sp.]